MYIMILFYYFRDIFWLFGIHQQYYQKNKEKNKRHFFLLLCLFKFNYKRNTSFLIFSISLPVKALKSENSWPIEKLKKPIRIRVTDGVF